MWSPRNIVQILHLFQLCFDSLAVVTRRLQVLGNHWDLDSRKQSWIQIHLDLDSKCPDSDLRRPDSHITASIN